jgi:hypothetical protein
MSFSVVIKDDFRRNINGIYVVIHRSSIINTTNQHDTKLIRFLFYIIFAESKVYELNQSHWFGMLLG